MIAPGFNSSCKQAELYYYDFIFDESRKSISEAIVNHIEHCQNCQEQVSQLNSMLSQPNDYIHSDQKESHHAITMMLKIHFAYIDKPVTCDIVKPFLLNFSDIRVPTPITAHIDNCQQCSEDLETIRELDLSHKQLSCLSQLFAYNSAEDDINCSEAQEAIPSVVSMIFSNLDPKILKHLCTCPVCNELLYKHRAITLKGLLKTNPVQHEFPCEKVSPKDFFDYVIPYGINPISDQYVKFRESLISHLRTCVDCLAKMQKLHTTIYGIYKRPESDVVTTYRLDESAKTQKAHETEDELYAGFPIRVDVKQREEVKTKQSIPVDDFTSPKKFKSLLKTVAVAAAVIFIAAVLLRNISTAGASAIDKIYEAIEKAQNVHISSFVSEEQEPIQEKWVSRTLNIYMTKTAGKYVLWDIADGLTKMKYADADIIETNKLTAENIADVEEKISGSIGLTPFYSISTIPENSNWSRVPNENLETFTTGVEVYDLTWNRKKYDGSVTSWRWRVFVNAETSLPQRAEWYVKLDADSEYTLDSVMTVEYLSETEMQTIVEKVSF